MSLMRTGCRNPVQLLVEAKPVCSQGGDPSGRGRPALCSSLRFREPEPCQSLVSAAARRVTWPVDKPDWVKPSQPSGAKEDHTGSPIRDVMHFIQPDPPLQGLRVRSRLDLLHCPGERGSAEVEPPSQRPGPEMHGQDQGEKQRQDAPPPTAPLGPFSPVEQRSGAIGPHGHAASEVIESQDADGRPCDRDDQARAKVQGAGQPSGSAGPIDVERAGNSKNGSLPSRRGLRSKRPWPLC